MRRPAAASGLVPPERHLVAGLLVDPRLDTGRRPNDRRTPERKPLRDRKLVGGAIVMTDTDLHHHVAWAQPGDHVIARVQDHRPPRPHPKPLGRGRGSSQRLDDREFYGISHLRIVIACDPCLQPDSDRSPHTASA